MKRIDLAGTKAVLFDFEGTLVDFQWNLDAAVRQTLEMLQSIGFNPESFKGLKYSSLMLEAQQRSGEAGCSAEEARDAIGRIYDRFDQDALGRWSLRPHIEPFLAALKDKATKTAVVSNIGRKTLAQALVKLNVDAFFDLLISRNDVFNLKPHPEGILSALAQFNVSREEALFIGDSLDDIGAARAAGVKALIILGGENERKDLLKAARPDAFFADYKELLAGL